MYSKTEKLGTRTYRGQKQIVVDILLAAGSPLALEEITAQAEAAGYTKLMNDWALKKVGVRGSVKYHLRELIEVGQVHEDAPVADARPATSAGHEKTFKHVGQGVRMSTDLSDPDILDMALKHYGYGRWDAPYWFIGPEPGRDNPEDDLGARCKAWISLRRCDLVDCKDHHLRFGETKWYREVPPPPTQSTWRQLIRLLLAYRHGKEPHLDDIRSYQQRSWGMKNGETCVIELSSLAAPGLDAPGPHGLFREQRIGEIQQKIRDHEPKFVVMYGADQKDDWEKLAGGPFPPDNIVRIGPTVAAFAKGPTSWGLPNSYWLRLASKLRQACQCS